MLILANSLSVFGQRKLPAKAYLSSAKIDVIEGRPAEAIAMLDSLFMYYGPHSEGLALMSQIYVDKVSKAPTAHEKAPLVDKMVAYFDSLRLCCKNESIDKKNRKDCDDLVPDIDSSAVQYWREFYNKGLEQLTTLQEFSSELQNATDSATKAYYMKSVESKADTAITNMELALKIDSTDHRPYLAIGSILEGEKKYEEAIGWFEKGLKYVDDSSSMLLSIAYNYINVDKYCEAVPHFENYTRLVPEDLANANNLTICYIRCDQDDKAVETYRRMLTIDSVHPDALLGLGSFYRRDAGELVKQAKLLLDEKKESEAKAMREKGNKVFDTASAYYERYIKAYPDSISGYDEYGLINYILGKYDKAVTAFKKLSELQPQKVENWISLGDSYFSLNDFANAVPAYEKAVELTPDKKELWERLSFLYLETGKPDKKTQADKKLQSLN
jgi:superkiller protein 3